MSCERCGGLMVIEIICELMEGESRREFDTRRCVNCGNFEDTRIRNNRVISGVSRQVKHHVAGTRRLNPIQTRPLERDIRTDDVMAESPRVRTPRLPVGAPSAKTRRLEPAHIEQPTQIVQRQKRYA
jgi:hypothetical protein